MDRHAAGIEAKRIQRFWDGVQDIGRTLRETCSGIPFVDNTAPGRVKLRWTGTFVEIVPMNPPAPTATELEAALTSFCDAAATAPTVMAKLGEAPQKRQDEGDDGSSPPPTEG